jgi:AraC-like DNA-binding protein
MEMTSKLRCWTAAELDTLRALSASTRVTDLARIVGHSKGSVVCKIRKYGLENLCRRPWTPDELAAIRAVTPETTARELARQLGRTPASVYQQGTRLGISFRRNLPWTAEQLDLLRHMAGHAFAERIAKATGRTARAVQQKAEKLGLPLKQHGVRLERRSRVDQRAACAREKAPRRRRPRPEFVAQLEWCKQCGAAVSNWQQHFERMGHRRPVA